MLFVYLYFMGSLDECIFICFFFNDTATTEIYTLSLHDALPISPTACSRACVPPAGSSPRPRRRRALRGGEARCPASASAAARHSRVHQRGAAIAIGARGGRTAHPLTVDG